MKSSRFFIVALALPAILLARTLTPEEAVTLALAQNASLAAGASRITAAEGLKLQAGLKPNPRLFLQTENLRATGTPTFRFSQDPDQFVYVSQVFEASGKRQSRVDAAQENIRANELALANTRAQLAGRVLTAYWAAVGAQKLAKTLADSKDVLDRTVQYHRDRVREGSLPEADLIRVQLEWQQVDLSYRNAVQEAKRAVTLLFREIGVAEEPGTELTGDLAKVPAIAAARPEEAVELRADVKAAVHGVEQARAATRLQKVTAKPDPEVLFGYKRTAGYNTLIAGVQVNLLVRNKNQGAIAAAAAEETTAAATLRYVRQSARGEIEAIRGEYEQKRQLVEETLPTMRDQAAETSRIAEAVYREGATDLLRLLDAERIRIQTETLYIRAMIDYRQAAVSLQVALGMIP